MNPLISSLFKSDLFWNIPAFFSGIAFLAAAYIYFPKPKEGTAKKFKIFAWVILGTRVLYSGLLSFFQYYVWGHNTFTNFFLNASADPSSYPKLGLLTSPFEGKLGYFTLYVFERFWLETLIIILVSCLFYVFLKGLRRRNSRFFEEGEPELGFAMALLSGWPGFVLFVFFVFVFIIAISIFRMAVLKQHLTTFGLPFLLSAFLTLIWGQALLQLFRLSVLKI